MIYRAILIIIFILFSMNIYAQYSFDYKTEKLNLSHLDSICGDDLAFLQNEIIMGKKKTFLR